MMELKTTVSYRHEVDGGSDEDSDLMMVLELEAVLVPGENVNVCARLTRGFHCWP